MVTKRDFYEVLEIERTADGAEIKAAYRKLARKYHPDVNPNDTSAEDKFKEVQAAYEVLSDDSKRQVYDRYGHEAPGGMPGGGQGFPGGFGDIFDIFFNGTQGGGRGGRGGSQRGADMHFNLEVSLEESFFGRGEADPHPAHRNLRHLLRQWRGPRHDSRNLPDVCRSGAGSAYPEHDTGHLPDNGPLQPL